MRDGLAGSLSRSPPPTSENARPGPSRQPARQLCAAACLTLCVRLLGMIPGKNGCERSTSDESRSTKLSIEQYYALLFLQKFTTQPLS